MEILGRIIALYLISLVAESVLINVFYPRFPMLPGDFPLDSYGLPIRIPLLSSLFVAIIISIFLSNVPLGLFRVF